MNGYAPPGGAGRPQSRGEEVANAASHGAALAAALVAGYWLVAWGRSLSAEGFAGVCVFVATMVWLYLASTVYHALPQGRAKRIFLKLDHGAVYLFIAGSYTVFASGHLGGPGAGAMLVVVWLVACAGVALKALGRLSSPWWSTGGYLAMGWLVLLAALPVVERAPAAGVQWLVAGVCLHLRGGLFCARRPHPVCPCGLARVCGGGDGMPHLGGAGLTGCKNAAIRRLWSAHGEGACRVVRTPVYPAGNSSTTRNPGCVLRTARCPPCRAITRRTMASPRPEPLRSPPGRAVVKKRSPRRGKA